MGGRRLSRFHVACSDGGAVAAAREMIYNACQQTQGSIFGEGLKERLSRWFVARSDNSANSRFKGANL